MSLPQDHRDQLRRFLMSGIDTKSAHLTATALWDQSPKDARKDYKRVMARFALEATSLDILGELMLKFRQQEHHLDVMTRHLKDEDQTASFHNTYRLTLNDCRTTLITLADLRDKHGRNRCEPPELKADREKHRQHCSTEDFRIGERERSCGSFWHTAFGARQAGIDLLSEDCAIRDIIRMRMLPKSPYEDYILAQALDALTEDEKKIDPEKLSKDEVVTDLHNWDPERHATPGMTQYREYELLAMKVFIERIQNYNKTWAKAEKHVDGLLAAKGMKPRVVHPYIGIPPIIQQAAEGDSDAIAELKAAVSPLPHHPSGAASAPRGDHDDIYERDFGKATTILVALLLAFTSLWTSLTLIAGPTALALVMPIESNEMITLVDANIEQTTNRQDAMYAKSAKDATNANPQTPWHSLASWRFNPNFLNTNPFFHAFSSTPSPSG